MTDTVDIGRRQLLLALAGAPLVAGALVACGDDPAPKSAPGPRPDADVKVRWRAVHGEQALLALYSATVAAHPSLEPALAPMRAHHEEHLAVLQADGPLPFGAVEPAPASVVPAAAEAALTALREAERAQSEARVADCLAATGPRLAAALASVAACEAGHDAMLGTV